MVWLETYNTKYGVGIYTPAVDNVSVPRILSPGVQCCQSEPDPERWGALFDVGRQLNKNYRKRNVNNISNKNSSIQAKNTYRRLSSGTLMSAS
jgi:hypothetical protein